MTTDASGVYEKLADDCEHQGQAGKRDIFLVLAADAALTSGQADAAERLRQRLLRANPHHMLKPFASLAEALSSPDIHQYVEDLRRQFPRDRAEKLLQAKEPVKAANQPPEKAASSPPIPAPVFRLQEPAHRPPAPTLQANRKPAKPVLPRPGNGGKTRQIDEKYPRKKHDALATGGWITTLLFLIVLLGALAVALFTFVGPFWR